MSETKKTILCILHILALLLPAFLLSAVLITVLQTTLNPDVYNIETETYFQIFGVIVWFVCELVTCIEFIKVIETKVETKPVANKETVKDKEKEQE